MRGFAITLVAVSLIALLVMLSTSLHGSYLSMERALLEPQPLIHASFLFETVAHDIHSIVGPDMIFYLGNESFGILFFDVIPSENFTADLSEYESFLEGTIANETHASIDVNVSALTPENMEVTINEDYSYIRDQNDTVLFVSSGGTGATFYGINITVVETRANVTPFSFSPGGDLNVTLMYSDLNGTITESGTVFSDAVNVFWVNYSGGGELIIEVGKVSGSDGGFSVEAEDVDADLNLFVSLPPLDASKKMGYEYDATMDYLQGDMWISRRIGK